MEISFKLNETKKVTFLNGQVLTMKCVYIDANGEQYLKNVKLKKGSPIALGAINTAMITKID